MNHFFTLLLTWVTVSISAQTFTQNGAVRLFNSGKKPVPNTHIIFSNATPTTAEATGQFRLVFTDKKCGDLAFKAEIAQKDYEIVNDKALDCFKLSRDTQAYLDIVVAKTGTIAAAQKAYYAVLDSTLKTHYFDEKVKLKSGRFNNQASKQAYQDDYETLQKQYSHQKKGLNKLAEQLARINKDDVNALHQDVLQLIKEGNIDAALQRLDSYGLLANINAYLKTKTAIEDSLKAENSFKQDLAALELQAHLYLITLNTFNATSLYEQIFVFDSTNLDILRGSAAFYKTINNTDKTLAMYAKILAHRSIETSQKTQFFLEGGDVLTEIGAFEEALNPYNQAKNNYAQWLKDNQNAPFPKYKLSHVYLRLGYAYLALGNTDKATIFYNNAQRLAQELSTIYPNNKAFKSLLTLSYEKLGKLNTHLGDLNKALTFYNNNYLLRTNLWVIDSNNVDNKNDLAVACEKLGTIYRDLKLLDKAFVYFKQYHQLKTAIYLEDINDIESKNNAALASAKLGAVYQSLNLTDNALNVFTNYNRLTKELYTENTNNIDFKNGLIQSFTRLAETHTTLNNLDKALSYYEERVKLNQELVEKYPNNVSYKNNLGVVYSKLGNIQTSLGDLDKALVYYEKDLELAKELSINYPKNNHFKNGLALAYSKLGTFYKDKKKDKTQADMYFEQGKTLLSQLVSITPTSADYKNNLKLVEDKLAEK